MLKTDITTDIELIVRAFSADVMFYLHFELIQHPVNLLSNFMQKPLGLLSLLDEESMFPNGTDLTFANKLKQHLYYNSCFRGEREKTFTVRHYAGEVFTFF